MIYNFEIIFDNDIINNFPWIVFDAGQFDIVVSSNIIISDLFSLLNIQAFVLLSATSIREEINHNPFNKKRFDNLDSG